MANLKDTIVLGNLTVTGKVVASDILVSGTGNEFDSIKVNSINAKDNATIEIANILNEVDLTIQTTGQLTLQSAGDAIMRSNSGAIELEATDDILFTVGGTQPMIVGSNSITQNDSATLGTYSVPWNGAYIDTLNTSTIGSIDNASTLTIGSSTDSLKVESGTIEFSNKITAPGISYSGTLALEGEAGTNVKTGLYPSGTASLGASNNKWNYLYVTNIGSNVAFAGNITFPSSTVYSITNFHQQKLTTSITTAVTTGKHYGTTVYLSNGGNTWQEGIWFSSSGLIGMLIKNSTSTPGGGSTAFYFYGYASLGSVGTSLTLYRLRMS